MRKIFTLQLFLALSLSVQGQVNFDDLPLPGPNTDYTQTIDTGDYFFDAYPGYEINFYGRKETEGGYSGFTYSNVKDSITTGPENDRAAFPAIGAEESEQYAIAHGGNYGMRVNLIAGVKPTEDAYVWVMYITNATYAVRSMETGDTVAKKFGGVDGTDPDWFLLTIKGYNYFEETVDSLAFYLADFRSDDPAEDYIIKDWVQFALGDLGEIDSLSFSLSSSDTGESGMNTPAYFCIDQIDVQTTPGVADPYKKLDAAIYPNPVSDMLYIKSEQPLHVKVYDCLGKVVLQEQSVSSIDVSGLPPGNYMLFLSDEKGTAFASSKFIKKP